MLYMMRIVMLLSLILMGCEGPSTPGATAKTTEVSRIDTPPTLVRTHYCTGVDGSYAFEFTNAFYSDRSSVLQCSVTRAGVTKEESSVYAAPGPGVNQYKTCIVNHDFVGDPTRLDLFVFGADDYLEWLQYLCPATCAGADAILGTADDVSCPGSCSYIDFRYTPGTSCVVF